MHGGDIYEFNTGMTDFSANVNPLGLPEPAKSALLSCITESVHYPDPYCRELTHALSIHEGVLPEYIVCTNGAADAIYRLIYSRRPKHALVLAPTFSEYEAALKTVDCGIFYHRLSEENGFEVGENILREIENMDMAFICNPNNPTGRLIEPGLLDRIYTETQRCGTLLIVDECFLDFLPEHEKLSAKKYLLSGNVLILKAFTKFYAMAGIRLGYALAPPPVCEAIRRAGTPWSVSAPAQIAGVAALSDTGYPERTRQLVKTENEYLSRRLEKLGLTVFSSGVNYIFFRSPIADLRERLISQGFLIRDCSDYTGLCAGYYRIAVKSRADNEALAETMRRVLAEE